MAEEIRTLQVTDEEVRLIRSALTSMLDDFGHDEADLLHAIKALIQKLPPQG
jgi:hypothetical protein